MKDVVIGFLGCGNVGGGVWNLLENFRKEIAHFSGNDYRDLGKVITEV